MFFYHILKNGYVNETCIFVGTTYMPMEHFSSLKMQYADKIAFRRQNLYADEIEFHWKTSYADEIKFFPAKLAC